MDIRLNVIIGTERAITEIKSLVRFQIVRSLNVPSSAG